MKAPDLRSRSLTIALAGTLPLACQPPPPSAAISNAPAAGPTEAASTQPPPATQPAAAPSAPPTGPTETASTQPPSAAPARSAAVLPLPERLTCNDRTGRVWEEGRGVPAAPPPAAKDPSADRVIAAARGPIRACYQGALKKDPSAEGRTAFLLHVGADGAVDWWCVGPVGTIATTTAVPCIASSLAGLRFAQPKGGAATVGGSFSFVDANARPAQDGP